MHKEEITREQIDRRTYTVLEHFGHRTKPTQVRPFWLHVLNPEVSSQTHRRIGIKALSDGPSESRVKVSGLIFSHESWEIRM